MGCYGIGITRLLAVALEYFTTLAKEDPPTELRWPLGFAPYSGAIALQKVRPATANSYYSLSISSYRWCACLLKESAKDALSADELERLLHHFSEPPRPLSTPNWDPTFFAGLLPRGDILVDDRPNLSLGRKLVDLRRLGVPWILIAKVAYYL